MHQDVRSKLDELKREELKRLRTLLKAKHAMAQEQGGPKVCSPSALRPPPGSERRKQGVGAESGWRTGSSATLSTGYT